MLRRNNRGDAAGDTYFDVEAIRGSQFADIIRGNDNGNEGWKCLGAVVIGLVLAQIVSRLTEYYTSTKYKPVHHVADASQTGHATNIIAGLALSLRSTALPIIGFVASLYLVLPFSGRPAQQYLLAGILIVMTVVFVLLARWMIRTIERMARREGKLSIRWQ